MFLGSIINVRIESQVIIMLNSLRFFVLGILVLVLSSMAYAQEVSKEQIKGLDEQVQEIKTDTLAIAAELNQLEEKLLFPSNTQVAVFVSLVTGETFRLDSVEIQLDGESIAHHIYTFKELEALQKGGVQRLYSGNVRPGDHELQVFVIGKSSSGFDFKNTKNFTVHKGVGPGIVEISLAAHGINFKDR